MGPLIVLGAQLLRCALRFLGQAVLLEGFLCPQVGLPGSPAGLLGQPLGLRELGLLQGIRALLQETLRMQGISAQGKHGKARS